MNSLHEIIDAGRPPGARWVTPVERVGRAHQLYISTTSHLPWDRAHGHVLGFGFVVDGLCGIGSMVCGLWFMVYGQWFIVDYLWLRVKRLG